jgi:hypothetical protein
MADPRPNPGSQPAGGGLAERVASGWRELDANQRLTGLGAFVLLFSLALPWFQQTGIETVRSLIYPPQPAVSRKVSVTLSGFATFGWVEAALLLVSIGVIALILARADRRPFHLPGGDGAVIAAAGAWCLFLIFWRTVVDKPTHVGLETGVEWGLLVAVTGTALMIFSGLRIRTAHRPEPPLPAAVVAVDPEPFSPPPARGKAASSGTQLQFGDVEPVGGESPTPDQPRPDDPTLEQLEIPIDEPPKRKRRRRDG